MALRVLVIDHTVLKILLKVRWVNLKAHDYNLFMRPSDTSAKLTLA